MKGLLLKDWYMFVKEVKFYVPFTAIYALVAAFSRMSIMFVMINVMLGSLIVKSLMAREEQNKWDSMAVSLPVTVKDIVAEKYVIGMIGIIAANVISFLVLVFVQTAFQRNAELPLLPFFLLYVGFGALFLAGELPVLFKFGTINGRLVFMGVVVLLAGISAGVSSMLGELSQGAEPQIGAAGLLGVAVALIVIAALAMAASIRLSVTFYKKREF